MKIEDALDEMPDQIDFSKATRGRFAGRLSQDATLVLIEPDVAAAFPTASDVNEALRTMLKVQARVGPESIRKAS